MSDPLFIDAVTYVQHGVFCPKNIIQSCEKLVHNPASPRSCQQKR